MWGGHPGFYSRGGVGSPRVLQQGAGGGREEGARRSLHLGGAGGGDGAGCRVQGAGCRGASSQPVQPNTEFPQSSPSPKTTHPTYNFSSTVVNVIIKRRSAMQE